MYRAETGGVGWFYSLEVARMIWELPYPHYYYRRFWVNSTRHHSRYGSYYPRKSEFATGLVFERNSGCLKKHGGGSSLPRIYGITIAWVEKELGLW